MATLKITIDIKEVKIKENDKETLVKVIRAFEEE